MNNFSISERVLHKLKDLSRPALAPIRRKKLKRTDFTIISNNCWGGTCYEYFGLPKQSPTVGMYFFADEYIRFLKNIKYYLGLQISMISAEKSRYAAELEKRGQLDVPIGVLDDVEIVMLHYKDKNVAQEKWTRRVKRVNWDNIIYKFSYMNGCTDKHIHDFEMISNVDGIKHFEFVTHPFPEYANSFVIQPNADGQIGNDTFYWNRYCNVVEILNR